LIVVLVVFVSFSMLTSPSSRFNVQLSGSTTEMSASSMLIYYMNSESLSRLWKDEQDYTTSTTPNEG
jgi:hypothetical protein